MVPDNGTITIEDIANFMSGRKSTLSHAQQTSLTVVYYFLSITGFIGNGAIILAVICLKSLRTCRNCLIANLAITDFVFAIWLVPFVRMPMLTNRWYYGSLTCHGFNWLAGTSIYSKSLTIIAIAGDRFVAITRAQFQDYLKRKTVIIMISSIWLVCLVITIPYVLLSKVADVGANVSTVPREVLDPTLHNETYVLLFHTCSYLRSSWLSVAVGFLQAFFLLPLPAVAMTYFTLRLQVFLKVNQRFRQQMREGRPSTGNNQNDRSQFKLFCLLWTMVFAYLLLFMPYTVLTLLQDLLWISNRHTDNELLSQIFIVLAQSTICVNPIIYGYLNNNFKREFARLLGFGRWFGVTRPQTRATVAYSSVPSTVNHESNVEMVQLQHDQ